MHRTITTRRKRRPEVLLRKSCPLVLALACSFGLDASTQWFLPIDVPNRQSLARAEVTEIGAFGIMRKARPTVPAHYHTGVDLKRPSTNYRDEPVYPMHTGLVVSLRDGGPYAFVILRHEARVGTLWTLYEHLGKIFVEVGDSVVPESPIARFLNYAELREFGRKFDHIHVEILHAEPILQEPSPDHPALFFRSYTLQCLTPEELEAHYYSPLDFLQRMWNKNAPDP